MSDIIQISEDGFRCDPQIVVSIGYWRFSQFAHKQERYSGCNEMSYLSARSPIFVDLQKQGEAAARRCFDADLNHDVIRAEYAALKSLRDSVLAQAEKKFEAFRAAFRALRESHGIQMDLQGTYDEAHLYANAVIDGVHVSTHIMDEDGNE